MKIPALAHLRFCGGPYVLKDDGWYARGIGNARVSLRIMRSL